MKRPKLATTLLLTLALARMAGDALGIEWLRGLATATVASPAPRVFSAVRGLETYSTRFFLEWTDTRSQAHSVEVDSNLAARLVGPYNRRNVYGAALAYGPVLISTPGFKPLLDSVLQSALCAPYPLMAEIGLDASHVRGNVTIRYEALRASALKDLPLKIEVTCP